MTVASSSSKSFTADGTPLPPLTPLTTQSLLGSLPSLIPKPSHVNPSSQSNVGPSSEVPTPMSNTAYHAYIANRDDDEDYESEDESPSQLTQQETETSNDTVKETKPTVVNDVDKYFQVPQPSVKDKDDETNDDSKPVQSESLRSKVDKVGEVAKCEKKSLPKETKPAVTNEISASNKISASNAEADEPNYYMRVARVLLGILILLVVGYIVCWVLLNVFGIDLWTRLSEKLWGNSMVDIPSSANNNTFPQSVEGQQQKQALTDKTAATLLNMMTAIRKHSA